MEERRRHIWLLVLVLFQPSFAGPPCSVAVKWEKYELMNDLKCTLTSLQMEVPLTTYIPKHVDKRTNMWGIDLGSSTINTVPVGVFQGIIGVTQLYMNNASINNIEPGALRDLTLLEALDLDRNNISEIQDGTFDHLIYLKKLDMVGNKLTTLKSLKGLTRLAWLDVERNNIETIDDVVFNDTVNLEHLILNRNRLINLNVDAFEKLHYLLILTMNNNRITSIPVGTFRNLGKLTTLDISFNNLTHLEFGLFGGLTSLQRLDVSDNNIAVLESKVLFPLKSLTRLNLDGNLLRTFDVDTMVSYLTTLQSVSLGRNQIRCDWLTNCIYVLTLRNITVDTGDSFKTKNVRGVYCESDTVQCNSITPTNDDVTVSPPLLATTKSTMESAAPSAEVVPAQIRISTTRVFFVSESPELVDVSTES